MDASVPTGAALRLDFIASVESKGAYATIIGNRQKTLPKEVESTCMRNDQTDPRQQ